jgi:hypothetical protein
MKSIRSKKWYVNQIATREHAVERIGSYILQPPFNADTKALEDTMRHNSAIQAEVKPIYEEINLLKYELSIYYK